MRHYFGYLADGALTSIETHTPGGWPPCDCSPGCEGLSNPDCKHENSTTLRASRAKHRPDIVGYIAYDCPCPAEMKHCAGHVSVVFAENWVVDGKLTPKPVTKHYIDGEEVTQGQTIARPPGTELEYKIASPGIPDGTKVNCSQARSTWVAPEAEWEMVFTNGETPVKRLVVPAQGAVGMVKAAGMLARGTRFRILGWAVG